jgi:anthranilate/para-aminobenzoate synthase component II
MATLANRAGDYFPVWGTCLGYESMMNFFGDLEPLERFDARRLEKALSRMNLREAEVSRSRLLSFATQAQRAHLRHVYVPYFDHDYGVSVMRFNKNAALRSTFRILSTCHDRAGKEYISMVEGRDLPFYGTQFHPDMDRTMTWMAAFFLKEARRSRHMGFRPASANPSLSHGTCLEEMKYTIPCLRSRI